MERGFLLEPRDLDTPAKAYMHLASGVRVV